MEQKKLHEKVKDNLNLIRYLLNYNIPTVSRTCVFWVFCWSAKRDWEWRRMRKAAARFYCLITSGSIWSWANWKNWLTHSLTTNCNVNSKNRHQLWAMILQSIHSTYQPRQQRKETLKHIEFCWLNKHCVYVCMIYMLFYESVQVCSINKIE